MMYEMITSKFSKKFWGILLSLLLAVGMLGYGFGTNRAYAVDVGANPAPQVDIAVSVPSDYPGTFLDFKEELTQKLIDEGMEPGSFRITDTAVSIDTNDLNGWYIRDHYRDESVYNALNLSAEQKLKQPYVVSNDQNMDAGTMTIASALNKSTNKFSITQVADLDQHILTYQSESGATNMAFAGYGYWGYCDWMLYPATSSSTRSFSFNIDASVINSHTLTGFGFLMNTAMIDGKLYGYLLYFDASQAVSGTGAMTVKKLNGVTPGTVTNRKEVPAFVADDMGVSASVPLGDQKKIRLTVELKQDSMTVQTQAYDASGNLGSLNTALRNTSIPQFYSGETLNGFGPWVGYNSHGCSGFSSIIYTDLEMSYETSAFDALKLTQYYQGADQKYFINLVGESGDPGIPDYANESYADGINRMNTNEIFYISNGNDGQVLKNPEEGKEALGSENGYYAMGDDPIDEIASYIYENYLNHAEFKQNNVNSDIPLANFYMKNDATEDEQLMTVHLKHLQGADKVLTSMVDKSLKSKDNNEITNWQFIVYDPSNTVVYNSGKVSSVSDIAPYEFNASSESGKYIFELTVWDSAEKQSKASQTYITAYRDELEPEITAENSTNRNEVTVTFTDKGEGIDEDGITFIKDNRGSGIKYYWINDSGVDTTPTDDQWVEVPVDHIYETSYTMDSTTPIYIWVKDECGNQGSKAMLQPTHVVVLDGDDNVIDDYYTIEKKPIIYLPPETILPDQEDEDLKFSGWTVGGEDIPDGSDITEGTSVPSTDNNEIIIRPNYSTDQAILTYFPNGGEFAEADVNRAKAFVTAKSSIIKDVTTRDLVPEREGYIFTGWKLLKDQHSANWVFDSTYANNEANLEVVSDQVANASENRGKNFVDGDYYYLVAQWQIADYTLRLDANGGGLNGISNKFENVLYGQNLADETDITAYDEYKKVIPRSGSLPTRPGCIFVGWSTTKNAVDNYANTFIVTNDQTITGSVVTATMPASDTTVYAVWKTDPNKFTVTFDADGGSGSKVHAYAKTTPGNYQEAPVPQKSGYTFGGWYKVDAAGDMTEAAYPSNPTATAITDTANQTYRAKWIPVENGSRFYIDCAINTGNVDEDGNPVYVAQASLATSQSATADQTVTILPSDAAADIEVNGQKYWFNENASNVLSGVVKGDNSLRLRYCYDRYLNVDSSTGGAGTGIVLGAGEVREGSQASVTWKADEGSQVAKVIVDGVVRDDLIAQSGITFGEENGVHENHTIYVEFAKKADPTTPSTPTDPTDPTDPDNPPTPVAPSTYQVKTSIVGCLDGSTTITPTTNVKAGEDHAVTWDKGNYEIDKIEVDGIEWSGWKSEPKPQTSIDFTGIAGDHEVIITVSKLPTIGGSTTEGHYTITVNKYGGDEKCWTDPTQVLDLNATKTIKWGTGGSKNYQIYKVVVDGIEKEIKTAAASGSQPFSRIDANHVVDVYFKANDTDPSKTDYSPDSPENVKVTTQIEGGPGTITGGTVMQKSDDNTYKVEWNYSQNGAIGDFDGTIDANGNHTAADPKVEQSYELNEVVVTDADGKKVTYTAEDLANNSIDLENIQADTNVVVKLQPATNLDVKTELYGEGYVSKSRVLREGQSYTHIMAQPAPGYKLIMVTIDDAQRDDQIWTAEASGNQSQAENQAEQDVQAMDQMGAVESSDQTVDDAQIPDDAVNVTEQSNDSDSIATENTDEQAVEPTAEDVVDMSDDIMIREAEAADNIDIAIKDNQTVDVTGIQKDHIVRFYTIPEDQPFDPEKDQKQIANQYSDVIVKIQDQNGNAILDCPGSLSHVEKGSPASATWTVPANYELVGVTVNGAEEATSDNKIDFASLNQNTTVVVTVKKSLPNESVTPPLDIDPTYRVNTSLQGGAGSITGSSDYSVNKDADIIWTITDPETEEVKYVFIDGVNHPELAQAINDSTADENGVKSGDYIFTNPETGKTYTVAVVIAEKGKQPTNVDKDGDGNPDTNIDPDGDGKPDINIDKDGDGEPDINIVPPKKDENGNPIPVDPEKDKPVVNVDTDGDGEPDVNVDTDGDGEPDINIVDEDGDGKPDPVDPKDPKKPNVNVDTDGDGKPDINKDTTGDGKPDTDIDTDGDGKPDLNEDNDGDGVPDTDVDTDGDGKPDVNVDVDGDGTPDINIVDEDGDGTPDPVKPGTKPTPTINVDTNGDGIPDENIDRNYGDEFYWKWVDAELAKQNSNSDNPSPDNPADNSKDKNDKSKKSKSSKTGDMTAPIAGGIALIALLSGLVLVLARRRKEN